MRSRALAAGAFLLMAAIPAGVTAQQSAASTAKIRAAIVGRNAQWTAAFNRGDLPGLLKIYDDSATVIPPESGPLQAHTAMQPLMDQALKGGYKNMKFETLALTVHGNFAYESGRSHFDVVAPGGKSTPQSDQYLVIWRKGKDGVWYYHVDIWW